MGDVTSKILLILDQDVADALCCYLDEEDVFPQVVDRLLQALPVPEPEMWTPHGTHDILTLEYRPFEIYARNYLMKLELFQEFLDRHPSVRNNRSTVFQINQLPEEAAPRVQGYCLYDGEERYWFDHDTNNPRAKVVGFYHSLSGCFTRTNAEMIRFLSDNGYIVP